VHRGRRWAWRWRWRYLGCRPLATQWVARLGLTGAAFIGAVLGVLLTLALARGVHHTLRLLLAGVIVGVVLSAARDLVTLAVPDVLQAMQAFTLGSTGFVGWSSCMVMAAVLLPAATVAWALGPWAGRSGFG
jgi:iron complex transport system permease protein